MFLGIGNIWVLLSIVTRVIRITMVRSIRLTMVIRVAMVVRFLEINRVIRDFK